MFGNALPASSELTIKVLEVGQLDALAHAKHIGRGTEAVNQHPDVSGVESRDSIVCV